MLQSTLRDLLLLLLVVSALSALGGLAADRRLLLLGRALEALALAVILALGVLGLTEPAGALPYARLWGRWPLVVGVDPLGGFLLVVLAMISIAAFVYAPRYLSPYGARERAAMRALLPLFTASMAFVLLAQDAVTFLGAWEGMSLTSLGLVLTEHHHGTVRRAGYVYFVATHAGALALLALFALLDVHGLGLDFAGYASGVRHLGLGIRSVVLILAILGFGSKAAIVPMHVWLPRAHPVAPSHVSALMSGVMIKVAIYGLMLVVFSWLGTGPLWWGALLILLGAASALLGVLYALMEHGLKTLLAYHSIENVGIIVLAIGAAEVARSIGAPQVMAFALGAALFHLLNHAVFKSGLFLAAGSVRHAAGTDDLERLGGLARAMPYTAAAFLLLSVAIAGLPPFNGFVSEWMTLESFLRLAHGAGPQATAVVLFGALALALTGGLAAACFVKASGVGFLGPMRSAEARRAREVPWPMYAAPLALAAVALLLGLAPGAVAGVAIRVADDLTGTGAAVAAPTIAAWSALGAPWTHPQWPALWLLAGLVLAMVVLVSLRASFGRGARTAPAWACGGEVGGQNAYTATAYSKSFRQIFAAVYRPQRVLVRTDASLPYLFRAIQYENTVRHVVDQYLYGPVANGGLALARVLRRLQSGSLRRYIGYLLLTLLAALIVWGH